VAWSPQLNSESALLLNVLPSTKSVLLDAGPIIGLFNEDDEWHIRCKNFFSTETYQYHLTLPVLTEAIYRIEKDRSRSRAAEATSELLKDVAEGLYTVHEIVAGDFTRMKKLRLQYKDQKLDFADLTLVIAAEKLGHGRIVTIDQNDFQRLRWKENKAFEIILPQ
jgi:uncharacterized protein